jgi:hypothetical protein
MECIGNSKDNMIMIDGISMFDSIFDPKRLVGTLALGTVAISTAVVTDLILTAMVTPIHMSSQR